MIKVVTAMAVSLTAGWVLAGSATGASARGYYPGCNCGPNSSSRYYKTVHPAKFVTRYHDVSVTKHEHRIHRVINVTRVQPIIHIHQVTRVHHHTVILTRNAYEYVTQQAAPRYVTTYSTQNYYDCSCGH